jgi:hypothetical protein
MDEVTCPSCGERHDISNIELSFDRPSAYFDVPPAEREARTICTEGLTLIDADTPAGRFFVRAVVVIPVRGGWQRDGFGWGTWAELSEDEFERVIAAGDKPERANEPPVPARLANELTVFPDSEGLSIQLRLQSPDLVPLVDILDEHHALGVAQRTGVYPEVVLEWVFPIVHPDADRSRPAS